MLRVFHGFECATNQYLFEQMLIQRIIYSRKNIFPAIESVDIRLEIDEFDRDDTIYLMAIDARKRVMGSLRILSSVSPYLLDGPLGKTFPPARLSTPRVWEASRFVFAEGEDANSGTANITAREILTGLGAIAREHRVERLVAVYDEAAAPTLRQFGLAPVAVHPTLAQSRLFVGLWDADEIVAASLRPLAGNEAPPSDLAAA